MQRSQRTKLFVASLGGLLAAAALSVRFAPGAVAAPAHALPPQTAADVSPEDAELFETRVRPLLARRCIACHGEKQQSGGLRLDAPEALARGGGRGAALVSGEPDKSLLVAAVRQTDALKMPPSGKLEPQEIELLTAWVRRGAPWPGYHMADLLKKAANGAYLLTPGQKNHWAFRAVRKPSLPRVRNAAWIKSPIDTFLLAGLEARALKPSPAADRRTLIRRATFDLIGLPPTAEEVEAFRKDPSPNAFEKIVDRLLASPRYGERWGRHWLDVARYADTKGYVFNEDTVYHNAYTYRDYVIRAFNSDLPYDQFLREQLAADRLAQGEDRRSLAALGFLTLGRRFLNNIHDIIDDRIDVTCRGLMGLTVGCARCHDHKFDPVPARDYYSLYGIFASSQEPAAGVPIATPSANAAYAEYQAKTAAAAKEITEIERSQIALLRRRVAEPAASLPQEVKVQLQKIKQNDKRPIPEAPERKLEPYFEAMAMSRLKALRETQDALKRSAPPMPDLAMTLQDAPRAAEARVFLRGNPRNPGPTVPRRFLQVLSGPERREFKEGSGRLELAQAIANRENPLTARVLVNRVWAYHFGEGLVRTPGDFGLRGEPPTHPELLDYVAARFMEDGWSIKKLHKLLMLSSAYQQRSDSDPRSAAIDPENRLLWRQSRQRLDLEGLRDSLLFVAGSLDDTMGGPSMELTSAPYSKRRTVYGFINRQNLQGMYRTFDFASPDTTSARRYRTSVPQQALFFLNSLFVIEQAQHLARRVEATPDAAGRVQALYRIVFARAPEPEELTSGVHFLETPSAQISRAAYIPEPNRPAPHLTPLERYAQGLLMTNEFCFVD